jgi:ferritin-like metal-binding protein YciE
MSLKSLEDLFVDELRDLYHAERQLTKALPKMAKNASTPELQEAFREHLGQTERHVGRLEEVFGQLGLKPKTKKCEAMEGLVEEAKGLLDEDAEADVLDAGLICAAQKVEHYEIAGYGTVVTWARRLGHDDSARLLQETLDEEKAADAKLTNLAESVVNQQAASHAG